MRSHRYHQVASGQSCIQRHSKMPRRRRAGSLWPLLPVFWSPLATSASLSAMQSLRHVLTVHMTSMQPFTSASALVLLHVCGRSSKAAYSGPHSPGQITPSSCLSSREAVAELVPTGGQCRARWRERLTEDGAERCQGDHRWYLQGRGMERMDKADSRQVCIHRSIVRTLWRRRGWVCLGIHDATTGTPSTV
jgi:hypothetical protein